MADLKQSIETYLDYLIECKNNPLLCNVPAASQNTRFDYTNQLIGHQHYVNAANKHYFVARILFLNHMMHYSLFPGHQCVENYLKAYWKLRSPESKPLYGHKLRTFLDKCITAMPESDRILSSPRMKIIVFKFEPFFDHPRYPVAKWGPKDGVYSILSPDDIYILDYFVFQMRRLIPVPNGMFDVVQERRLDPFASVCDEPKHLSSVFSFQNINCISQA